MMKLENRNTIRPLVMGASHHSCRAVGSRLSLRVARRAITLTEVLISMGILTLGLLGVAALFPVGGFYMQKAEVADRASSIAQQAMNDLVARGYLSPKHWITYQIASDAYEPTLSYVHLFGGSPAATPYANSVVGSAVVLDPLGVAGYLASDEFATSGSGQMWISNFPGKSWNFYGTNSPSQYWSPWNAVNGLTPIRRVTLGDANGVMRPEIAEVLFGGRDDLAIDIPDRDDLPARQNWDVAPSGPLARQWTGDYSWLATIVPTSYEARNALGSNPGQFDYDVSVVVFHKRVLGSINRVGGAQFNYSPSEIQVRAAVKSTGISGGELLLTAEPSTPNSFADLRAGEWIMLYGPHPQSSPSPHSASFRPYLFMSWYQVMAIDENIIANDRATGNPPPEQRYVTLRGPQWPWVPENNGNTRANNLSNDLCVAIFPGAVAVHTKAMRLEGLNSNAWNLSGGVSGAGGPAGPGGPASGGPGGSGGSPGGGGGGAPPPPWWFP